MTSKEYKTITDIKGPLVFLEKTEPVAYGEIVTIRLSDGSTKNGQVLDTSDDMLHQVHNAEVISGNRFSSTWVSGSQAGQLACWLSCDHQDLLSPPPCRCCFC